MWYYTKCIECYVIYSNIYGHVNYNFTGLNQETEAHSVATRIRAERYPDQ